MKKLKAITFLTAAAVGFSSFGAAVCADEAKNSKISFDTFEPLYVHAVTGSDDSEAWTAWQSAHDDDLIDQNENEKYFFLPSSASDNEAEIYNASSEKITLNGTTLSPGETKIVSYEPKKQYTVEYYGEKLMVSFLHSTAEAAVYVNNSDADGEGAELMWYLFNDKSVSAKATGAIVDRSGEIDNTPIKKIKGRGNTTWWKTKKPFNITYDSKVSIAGMPESKKYSLLANYQDDSLSRNRILYDLSDAVGMPYASDSRYVDFYVNGYYWGSYQMTQKIEVGSSNVVNDIEEEDYLNEDGTVKEDFPFVCEVDPSAGDDDFTVNCSDGIKLTIKSPDLSSKDEGYSEVKKYVKSKFNAFIYACANPDQRDLSEFADVDSLTKLYLINELGKNWDSGVSSLFFTYKQDKDGNYKFFGSPVWDYDNSLGNAVGVKDDLRSFGVTDYTKYTGWWCRYKGLGKNSKKTNNIMNNISRNEYILNAAPTIWFEEFVPALDHFSGAAVNKEIGKELYTRDEYFELIKGSAEMNYTSGWLLNTGDWIADHSSLNKAVFDQKTGKYEEYETRRIYPETFDGMYTYCTDWMMNRAAWLSGQMYDDYKNAGKPDVGIKGDMNADGVADSADALIILRASNGLTQLSESETVLADVNADNTVDSADALAVLRFSAGMIDEGIVIVK